MTDYNGAQYVAVYDKFKVRQISKKECPKSKRLCIYSVRSWRHGGGRGFSSFPFLKKQKITDDQRMAMADDSIK